MKVSLITVTRNSAATIVDTLRSVNSQSHPEIEQLVIDGASSDATLELVERHGERVSAVVSEPDEGIYDAMNKGIALAGGDVIGLINSDDFYASTEAVARVAEVFSNPDLDAVYADLCYVARHDLGRIVRYWRSSPFVPGSFAAGWAPPHPTLFVRRSVYERFGGFDTRYRIAADVELMMRFLEVHRIRARHVPEVLVHMRMGGASNRSIANVIKQNREVWRALRAHGLARSPSALIAGKLLSRSAQFVSRPPV